MTLQQLATRTQPRDPRPDLPYFADVGPKRPEKPPTVDRPQKEKGYRGKREGSEPERYVFSRLFGELGIDLRPGDNFYRCPWHDDTNTSLSIDAGRCVWYCFGCGKKGGLRALVDSVGIIPLSPNLSWGCGMIPTSGDRDDDPAEDDWETRDPLVEYRHRICGTGGTLLANEKNGKAIPYYDDRWDCPNCGPKFRVKAVQWLLHVSGGVFYASLYDGGKKWDALTTAFRRAGIEYARITTYNGVQVVITSAEVDGSEYVEQPARFLATTIPRTAIKNPISTSRGWKKPKDEREVEDEGMKLITISAFSPEEMLDIAEEIGFSVVGHRFYPPEGMPDWQEKLVKAVKSRERDGLPGGS